MDRRTLFGGTAALAASGLVVTAPGESDGLYVERRGERQIMVWTREPGHLWIRYELRHFTDPAKRMDAWRLQEITAVRQAGPPPATAEGIRLATAAAYPYAIKPAGALDHFGGLHGDELLQNLLFLLDGRAALPSGVTAAGEFELTQDTQVLDPAQEAPTVLGDVNVRHIFTASGLRIRWVLRWRAARVIEYAYGAMLPAVRADTVTTRFRYLDQAVEHGIGAPGHRAPPADSYGAELYNTVNGLTMSVEVEPGFFNGYAQSDGRGVWVYDGDTYNKVYPTRVSKPGAEQVAPGDTWHLDATYRIRYPS
ncbi:hypothetical protein ACIBEJ_46750 [Nonomuraea sp. NPDC050790]|uniref:hypothetical protein n=1 Tax=Nonomuraea sp. NPDC050790 TaxID=3364371 RepID=UPI003789D4AD